MNEDRIVLLVELRAGEVVAVPFASRAAAERWESLHGYEVVQSMRVISARALSVGARMRENS